MYDNTKLCSECGGECCKSLPGILFPEDVGEVTHSNIKRLLDTGRYTIDWWEGDPRYVRERRRPLMDRCMFVRPAVKGKEGETFDPAWSGNDCTFLTSSGCQLEPEKRPTGCKLLEPKSLGCRYRGKMKDSKREGALAWLKYQVMLDSFRRY